MEIQRYYEQIAESTLEMIVVFDGQGKIIASNHTAEQELGYQDRELLGVNIDRVLPGLIHRTEDGALANVEWGMEVVGGSIYRKNQTCFPADIRLVCMDREEGIYVCLAINSRERVGAVRELDRVKNEAGQAEKTKNEFVANVTHELRTPVNGILGHVRNLLEIEDRPQQQKTMAIIERCCVDMNKLINNILDFSKLQADKFTLEEREFDFVEMMHRVEDIHSSRANEKGLTLQFIIDGNVPARVVGDELRITQVLNNLISNAIKFTDAGKVVVQAIKTQQMQAEAELFFLVIDSGIGISDEEKDKLFKSFSQVDASITRRYGGSGLGLVVCKQIVELMHGSINLESEKGKGSMFSFSVVVKLPADRMGEEEQKQAETSIVHIKENAYSMAGIEEVDAIYRYGSPENVQAVRDTMEKLVLCIEMDNWEKAESFAGNLKRMLEDREDLGRLIFRLELAIRKENYEKAMKAYETLREALGWEGE